MAAIKSCSTTYLAGDWTSAGIVQQLPRLTGIRFSDDRTVTTIAIDCSGIENIDLSGFELLYVWLHCVKLRGLRTELVNVPDWMCETQKRMGIVTAFEAEMKGNREDGNQKE